MISFTSLTHLFQWCVGHTEAAEADVHKGFLQFPEEAGVRPGLEVPIRQQIGELLPDGLNQTSLWHMVMDQSCDAFHITWCWMEEIRFPFFTRMDNIF